MYEISRGYVYIVHLYNMVIRMVVVLRFFVSYNFNFNYFKNLCIGMVEHFLRVKK